MLLALSDQAVVGLIGLGGVIVTVTGGIVVALIGRENKRQTEATAKTVSEFEQAWKARGEILDGTRDDLAKETNAREKLEGRLGLVEQREHNCLEALEHAHNRLAVLEERLGVTPDE